MELDGIRKELMEIIGKNYWEETCVSNWDGNGKKLGKNGEITCESNL